MLSWTWTQKVKKGSFWASGSCLCPGHWLQGLSWTKRGALELPWNIVLSICSCGGMVWAAARYGTETWASLGCFWYVCLVQRYLRLCARGVLRWNWHSRSRWVCQDDERLRQSGWQRSCSEALHPGKQSALQASFSIQVFLCFRNLCRRLSWDRSPCKTMPVNARTRWTKRLAELNLTIDILFLTDAYFNIQYQSAGTTKYY